MTDQQRADLCAREGYSLDTTPTLDRLAVSGQWFNRAYTSTPICVAARISMLTGRYPSATRCRTNYNIEDTYAATNLFQHFRSLGYATAMIGKNHSHITPPDVDRWFEAHHVGLDDDHENPQFRAFTQFLRTTHMFLSPTATPFPLECQQPHRLVNQAQSWLTSKERDPARPFLLFLSFPEPHNPLQVSEPYFSMFPPQSLPKIQTSPKDLAQKSHAWRFNLEAFHKAFPDYDALVERGRSNYHGMLRLIDDQIARFLSFLDSKNLRDNTLIVFLSDHGDFVGEYGLLRKGPELPEPLTRIPFLFTGPGIAANKKPHPAHISITDLFPTLCHAADAANPNPIPDGVQGRSLWPLLTGQPYPAEEFQSAFAEHGYNGLPYTGAADEAKLLDPLQDGLTPANPAKHPWGHYDGLNSRTQSGTLRMVRQGPWKLCLDNLNRGQLYNLDTDPHELHNLFNHPSARDAQSALTHELALWLLRTQDPLPLPRPSDGGRRYILKRHPLNYTQQNP